MLSPNSVVVVAEIIMSAAGCTFVISFVSYLYQYATTLYSYLFSDNVANTGYVVGQSDKLVISIDAVHTYIVPVFEYYSNTYIATAVGCLQRDLLTSLLRCHSNADLAMTTPVRLTCKGGLPHTATAVMLQTAAAVLGTDQTSQAWRPCFVTRTRETHQRWCPCDLARSRQRRQARPSPS